MGFAAAADDDECRLLLLLACTAASAKGAAADIEMAIKQCAALGFFLWNLIENRNLGNNPPYGYLLTAADIKPGPSCPSDADRAKYAEFMSDGNTVRRNNMRLYLAPWLMMTFRKTLDHDMHVHPKADAPFRFHSLYTGMRTSTAPVPSASSPVVPVQHTRTLSPSAHAYVQ